MITTRLTPLCVAVLLAFPVLGCDNSSGPPDLGEITDLLAYYRDGEFIYEDDRCFFRRHGTKDRSEFECGVIGIGLASGVLAADVADLVAAIEGEITRDRSGGDFGWIMVAVPARSERQAILRVFPDDRARWGRSAFREAWRSDFRTVATSPRAVIWQEELRSR